MRRTPGTMIVNTSWGKMCVYSGGDGVSQTLWYPAGVGTFWDGPVRLPFYDEFSDPTALAIEIGAFCGEGALYLASRNRRVIAVEPVHWAVTEGTIAANGLENVALLKAAAYSEPCWMVPAPDEDQGHEVAGLLPAELEEPGGIALVRIEELGNPKIPTLPYVPGVRLDDFLETYARDERVCLIKSDAQGCDLRALVGLERTITRWRPAVLFEFEATLAGLQGDTWEDHKRFFEKLDYSIEGRESIGYPHDFVALPKEKGR